VGYGVQMVWEWCGNGVGMRGPPDSESDGPRTNITKTLDR